LGYQLSFNVFDEASVTEWKGRDLKLADQIPDIDLIIIAVQKVCARLPGVDVMVTIFCDFRPYSAKKIGIFLKNKCYDQNYA
jgi:hypothetical protein